MNDYNIVQDSHLYI